jgi:hypothetical protein
MRQYHRLPNRYWQPTINIDRIWSLVTEQHREVYKSKTDVAPVIDVTRAVSFFFTFIRIFLKKYVSMMSKF